MCCVSHTYIYAWCISCGVYLIHISCMVYLMCCVSHTYIYAWCISCVVYLIHTSMHGVSHVLCISYIFHAWCISCVVYLIHTSMHGVSHVLCISYIHLCMVYLMWCVSHTYFLHGVSHVLCISYIHLCMVYLMWCVSHTYFMQGVSHVLCISYIYAWCISCVTAGPVVHHGGAACWHGEGTSGTPTFSSRTWRQGLLHSLLRREGKLSHFWGGCFWSLSWCKMKCVTMCFCVLKSLAIMNLSRFALVPLFLHPLTEDSVTRNSKSRGICVLMQSSL